MRYLLILFAITFCMGCSENERLIYETKPAVYFPDYNDDNKTASVSFVVDPEKQDMIFDLGIAVLGSIPNDLNYELQINSESTAIEGVHYKSFNTSQVFPAGKLDVVLPITIMYSPNLDNEAVTLSLSLLPTNDIDLAYKDRLTVDIQISNLLFESPIWNYLYLGEYSKVKHQIFIDLLGHEIPQQLDDALGYKGFSGLGYWNDAAKIVLDYIITNSPVYDENGKKIEPWIIY
ncbi:DUF4843 domain-containing protein [Marinifilum sp. RC60d5]|uniref:DUF4843 domain-containing protein n=1 Tax=Marinifilum sp. RC60d5 TaxID=3458414 RepID=UPI004035A794